VCLVMFLWPWPRSRDLDTRPGVRCSKDVPAHQKWST